MTLIEQIKADREAGKFIDAERQALLVADELAKAVKEVQEHVEACAPDCFWKEISHYRWFGLTEALTAYRKATGAEE